jgi:hypothetical protein
MSLIAYKFLRRDRVGPFSGFRWPEPGVWVESAAPTTVCRSGIHACRPQDLPWWLSEELWQVELRGEVRIDDHKLIAPAGRLSSRVAGWTPACAQEYADACAWRARDHAVQALTRAGHSDAAQEVALSATLEELLELARRLASTLPETRINLTIAGDGAVRALSGAAPTTAYIAAHAALRVDGGGGYSAERDWQVGWLVERLRLSDRTQALTQDTY